MNGEAAGKAAPRGDHAPGIKKQGAAGAAALAGSKATLPGDPL